MPAIPWRRFSAVEPDRDYLAMASRLPLVSHRTSPRFMRLTLAVARQLQHSPGLVGNSLRAQPIAKTFRTLSGQDQHTLATFTRALPHLQAMTDLRPHMRATTFARGAVHGSSLPVNWADAFARRNEERVQP